ncbi:hypothetical protein HCN44_002029 [Aphidius gifuensis]|uniref:Aquaporin n=1 Tax=Aphidius gifuensis TaxID=684658 RepID=A0A834Y423_APHGI|nr:hypothetical protein HCN44_002029 [Aphidius gifuensis]
MKMEHTSISMVTGNPRGQSGTSKINIPNGKNKNDSFGFNEVLNKKSGWNVLIASLAEFLGTAVLIFVGCSGCLGSLGSQPPPFQVAFVFGFTVTLIIQSIGHISDAHINPAITIGSIVLGKKSLAVGIFYIFAQCAGAIVGYGFLKIVTPIDIMYATNHTGVDSFCVTQLNEKIHPIQGFLIELAATGVLMFMCSAVWDSRNEKNSDSIPIKFGLVIAGLCMVFGPHTGCSLNPARSLGPALWTGSWDKHWIYWLGPMTGAFIASVLYRWIFAEKLKSSVSSLPVKAEVNANSSQARTENGSSEYLIANKKENVMKNYKNKGKHS